VVRFYEYFYKKKFNSPKYKFKPSDRVEKIINTFLTLIHKYYNSNLVGEDFLWSYFIYQFNYWRNAELTTVYGKFRIELIIGRKALQRYREDRNNLMWTSERSEIITFYKLKKSD